MRLMCLIAVLTVVGFVPCVVVGGEQAALVRGAAGAGATDHAEERAAIEKTLGAYMQAYASGNGKAVAAHFTTDAEYVDEEGNVVRGRAALEAQLAANFSENPGEKLELKIDSLRIVGPGIALVDGKSIITVAEKDAAGGKVPAAKNDFTAVYVKTEGAWLVASVRDHKSKASSSRREQLKQFDWLLGEWIHEGDGSVIHFSCKPIDDGNFLLREFTFKIAGRDAMKGSQRIGWDPVAGRFESWTFDSEGSSAYGTWHRDGESWVLKSSGQSGDGKTASVTSVFTPVSPHIIAWQNLEYVLDGEQLPPTNIMKLVRKPPQDKPAAR